MADRIFSTGRLYARVAEGEDPIEFATLQSISVEEMSQKKELYGPAFLSPFPEAIAYYGSRLEMKAKHAAISAAALAVLAGAAITLGEDEEIVTSAVTRTTALPYFIAVFETQDLNGVPIVLTANRVSCPGVQIPFSLEDFTMPDFGMVAYPDDADLVCKLEIGTEE